MRVILNLILSIILFSCTSETQSHTSSLTIDNNSISPKISKPIFFVQNGDVQTTEYQELLRGKTIGLIVNQSSVIGSTHLIDTLIALDLNVQKIFAPEHGIRGKADAGEKVNNAVDAKTNLPIISLYGSHKKPTPADLEGIEIVVFDLQDVGARFYTYISTMHYVMEACAENNIPFVVLDRPNPNGDYVAGPVLEDKYKSFVGMHNIPIVHGLTVGELAKMINGEKWLKNSVQVTLTVVKCKNYTHDSILPLSIKPSPNLPDLNSIRWYPTLCLFEPTNVSIGRGTLFPFETFGSPKLDSTEYPFRFTPISIEGMSKHPKFENQVCYGFDLKEIHNTGKFRYDFIIDAFEHFEKEEFIKNKGFFFKLSGTEKLWNALVEGKNAEEMEALFSEDLERYKILRKKYLLYPDFNGK